MLFKKVLPVTILALSLSCSAVLAETAVAAKAEPINTVLKGGVSDEIIKQILKAKLEKFNGFSANFSQDVIDAEGNTLQSATGKLIVKRPNLIYWQTTEPDETLVVSDGNTLWFYNPFVEQVSAFNVINAVLNTPILLLSDTSEQTWADYHVSQQSADEYQIRSLNQEAQVTSLNLVFADDKLAKFTIVDATGQLSHFNLSKIVTTPVPSDDLFKFTLPANVDFDDQR